MKNKYSVSEKLTFDYFIVDIEHSSINALPKINLQITYEPELKDHYRILVYKSYRIIVIYGNKRSLGYAFDYLSKVQNEIETGIYEDGPDFEMRGIIEGFYGVPWSHQDRLNAIDFIKNNRMNTYFYAPKNDQYHRQLWRELYPVKPMQQLLELVSHSKEANVDLYFCISPGNDFDYSRDEEFEALFRKINQLLSHQVIHFALLMDDIDYKLNDKNTEKFRTPGRAHAYITNRLNNYLKSSVETYTLVMCPTEYWQNWNTDYRKDLKAYMHEEVLVFWTGYHTIAEYIPNIDGKNVKSYFGHPLILWDNYPVNDMTVDRIFLGPLVNRGSDLCLTHQGMVSNPMIEWHLSKIALMTMADYMWDSRCYHPEKSYQKAILKMTESQPDLYQDFKNFCDNNRHSLIDYYQLNHVEDAISKLDYEVLDLYFTKTQEAFERLIEHFNDKAFINQAMPWFNRFSQDFQLWKKIKNNCATLEDTAYIAESKYTIGSNIIVKVAKKLNLYQGDIYKKNRINYWDQN